MNLKKIVTTLIFINVLQFIIGLLIWITTADQMSIYIYLSVGLMLMSSLITVLGLYMAGKFKDASMRESIQNLEDLNTKLRAQRHDYLNHFQIIYGLMELKEYDEAKKYIEPVFKDLMKVSKALKTAQPAVNALLQAKIEAAEKKNINLFLEIRTDLKSIPIEPWNLCKVLANIMDNSMTAVSENKEEKNIYIEIGENQVNYTFLIYNNGPIIPADQLSNIFKQGFTTKKEQGHGMGLYIVSKIIREAGGTIEVNSDQVKTSFLIILPKDL
ncbi:Spo0B domain-containing protein [Mobilitalea sibirica]|uniref:histidine kinase n=1 Tax=Mobilitalea sibirica TaxID=1462919 RepID=A0A8J7KRU2_9FIRM|nr:Spo0B domain-containing protein [Mobilitalea sibirica]MBH1939636.1 Spo0B domain-containing protein [Mobilitalea sibirica]